MLRFGTIGSGWIVDEYIHGAKDSGLWELTALVNWWIWTACAMKASVWERKSLYRKP